MFYCSHCDAQSLKWQGRCNECGKWGTLSEDQTQPKQKKQGGRKAPILDLAKAKKQSLSHTSTGVSELDRVLSGGFVPGSVTLLSGEPGIGKSTLIAQVTSSMAAKQKSFYVSGEESEGQILMRLERLKIDPEKIVFSNSVDVDAIIATATSLKPSLLIIDSIQTMISEDAGSIPGTPNAVRAATAQLIGFAKSSNISVLLIGQITKEGSVAGPKTLEHLVDTLLTLEGDKHSPYRILRSAKNRFGTTDEVGIFEMKEHGMQAVENPSARFLEERQRTPGSVITCIMEGTRLLLVEIQALAEKSHFANPIRRTSGYDSGRLQMLLAIISKRAGVNVSGFDVYVNVIGGIKVKETATDLAVCAAIISSVKEIMPKEDTIYVGELGLGGEVRSVPFLDRRTKEATRLGIQNAITPKTIKNIKNLT